VCRVYYFNERGCGSGKYIVKAPVQPKGLFAVEVVNTIFKLNFVEQAVNGTEKDKGIEI
jgi:hypothetical protein